MTPDVIAFVFGGLLGFIGGILLMLWLTSDNLDAWDWDTSKYSSPELKKGHTINASDFKRVDTTPKLPAPRGKKDEVIPLGPEFKSRTTPTCCGGKERKDCGV